MSSSSVTSPGESEATIGRESQYTHERDFFRALIEFCLPITPQPFLPTDVQKVGDGYLCRGSRTRRRKFEPVFTWAPSENSVLILEPVKNRESESSRPFFRTLRRNLEGCTRTPEISLRTEIAASWATRAQKTHKSL